MQISTYLSFFAAGSSLTPHSVSSHDQPGVLLPNITVRLLTQVPGTDLGWWNRRWLGRPHFRASHINCSCSAFQCAAWQTRTELGKRAPSARLILPSVIAVPSSFSLYFPIRSPCLPMLYR